METLSPTAFADRSIMARAHQRARAEHERIFGTKTSFRQMAMDDISSNRFLGKGTVAKVKLKAKAKVKSCRRGNNKKKEICPHCATRNFVKIDFYTNRCTKCKFER